MDRHAKLVAIALLWLIAAPAFAGYANLQAPAGWVKTSAGATYKAPAGFAANNGVFHTTATVNVGGRVVTVPAGMRVAANAASAVALFARANPLVFVGSVVLSWLESEGLTWTQEGGWVKVAETDPSVQGSGVWGPNHGSYGVHLRRGTPADACMAGFAYQGQRQFGSTVYSSGGQSGPMSVGAQWLCRDPQGGGWFAVIRRDEVCGAGYQPTPDFEGQCVATGTVPAVEQDFASIAGIPDDALSVGARVVPVPVQLPEIVPQRVPVGSPVPKPGTNPQQYVQPVIDVVPRPTLAEPWRVELVPIDVTSENPSGLQDVTPIDEQTPEGEPGAAEPKPELCDIYPDVLACQKMGTIEAEPLPQSTVSVAAITPESGFGEGGGSCPAPRTGTVMGQQVAMTWQPMCDLADGIRPVVIAIAWLSAIAGFLGLSRKGE